MSEKTPKEAFLVAFHEATYPAQGSGTSRLWGNVEFKILPDGGHLANEDDEVYLDTMKALMPEQGKGTKAIQFLCDLADQHGVAVALHAIPTQNGMQRSRLTAFYKKVGFETYSSDQGLMWREPQPVAASPQKNEPVIVAAPALTA